MISGSGPLGRGLGIIFLLLSPYTCLLFSLLYLYFVLLACFHIGFTSSPFLTLLKADQDCKRPDRNQHGGLCVGQSSAADQVRLIGCESCISQASAAEQHEQTGGADGPGIILSQDSDQEIRFVPHITRLLKALRHRPQGFLPGKTCISAPAFRFPDRK